MTKLLIKYQNQYICEKNRNEIDFINVPKYHKDGTDFSNISIIVTLLVTSHLKSDYSSNVTLFNNEWSELFEEYFLPEYLYQVDDSTYIYDLDKLLLDNPEYTKHYEEAINNLPYNLILKKHEELKNKAEEELYDESIPYSWNFDTTSINPELELFISKQNPPITDNDVLLMYSGGKDSTLAAIRLYNAGYNIHFIHFDNGHMKDADKPYLTYQKTFGFQKDYYFEYEYSKVDVSSIFKEYYSNWSPTLSNDPSLTSEIRCLSCRLAMYTKAIMIAKEKGFKYIAEGARISQKFMLEQLPMIEKLKELAASFGIKLLFPVLYLDDDQKEIEELINNGYSSKTWESKCLIGKPAKDKTREDEQIILTYYENDITPKVLKNLNHTQ